MSAFAQMPNLDADLTREVAESWARLRLSVPFPTNAGANHQHQHSRRGVYLTEQARAWREEVGWLVKASGQTAPAGPLCLTLRVYSPDRRRRDIDNIVKGLQDCLCRALGIDDSRIAELHVYRMGQVVGGRIDVEMREIER